MIINVSIAGKKYAVKIDDLHARPVKAEVDGEVFEIWPEEAAPELSAPAAQAVLSKPMPAAAAPQAAPGGRDVNAPLPGVIIEINVKAGTRVKAGDPLLVLEAMKMKNIIRAGRDGVIAEVLVSAGDQVRHNQPLFRFEA
ncbi:MAG: biotin/lipoyl-containing protein [Anaerolineaceae bacterium]